MKRSESLSWPTMIIERRFEKLNPTPEYQRDSVWSRPQKQLLIDTILRNMDIPKLYFRVLPPQDEFDFEIIDGQQRVRAIYEFRRNQFALSERYTPEYAGMYYDDLPEDAKDAIDLYQINITVISEASDEEIRDMFSRLQNGKPLNAAEKRNALGGNMRDYIADLVRRHPVFQAYQRKNTRFSHEQMAAQCSLLEITGNITNVRNTQLEKLYESHKDFNPSGSYAKRIERVMNFLGRAFKQATPEFKGRAQFVSLYWLVSRTIETYTMTGREDKLREFFIDFEFRRRLSDDSDVEMIRYSEALSRSSDGADRIEYRHEMLMREWLNFAPDLALKDPQRAFTPEQRIVVYRRDNGICQICNQLAAVDDYEVDHVIAHAAGGPTSVANGQTTHKLCNLAKGKY